MVRNSCILALIWGLSTTFQWRRYQCLTEGSSSCKPSFQWQASTTWRVGWAVSGAGSYWPTTCSTSWVNADISQATDDGMEGTPRSNKQQSDGLEVQIVVFSSVTANKCWCGMHQGCHRTINACSTVGTSWHALWYLHVDISNSILAPHLLHWWKWNK